MKLHLLFCFVIIISCYKGYVHTKTKGIKEKVRQLTDMTKKKSVVQLNLNKFKEYVSSPPRDYSFIVMFTAMASSRKCATCKHVYDEYMIVANSFHMSRSYSDKLFFGIVDFDAGSRIFKMMKLDTVPIIIHFPAKGKPKPADKLDFKHVGINAKAIGKWIKDRTGVQVIKNR